MKGALQRIGAHSEPLNPAPPETLTSALGALCDLIDEWVGEDFDVGAIKPDVPADDLGEEPGAKSALTYGLMFKMSGLLGLDPTLTDVAEGRRVIEKARERWQYIIPTSRKAPVISGQGNRGYR